MNKVEYAIYPNPGYGIFYIKNENSGIKNIRVFNALGSEVLNRNTSMDDLIQIDLNGHIPGVYYILANGVTAQKILLK